MSFIPQKDWYEATVEVIVRERDLIGESQYDFARDETRLRIKASDLNIQYVPGFQLRELMQLGYSEEQAVKMLNVTLERNSG